MLPNLIIAAVAAAAREVIPQVARQAENAVSNAHATPASAPISTATAEPVDVREIEARLLDKLMQRPEFQAITAETAPIPWYKSQVVVGGVVAIVGPILVPYAAKYGFSIEEVNGYIAAGVAAIGGAIVLYGRIVKGTAQPVTLTARRAESDGPDAIDMG